MQIIRWCYTAICQWLRNKKLVSVKPLCFWPNVPMFPWVRMREQNLPSFPCWQSSSCNFKGTVTESEVRSLKKKIIFHWDFKVVSKIYGAVFLDHFASDQYNFLQFSIMSLPLLIIVFYDHMHNPLSCYRHFGDLLINKDLAEAN